MHLKWHKLPVCSKVINYQCVPEVVEVTSAFKVVVVTSAFRGLYNTSAFQEIVIVMCSLRDGLWDVWEYECQYECKYEYNMNMDMDNGI